MRAPNMEPKENAGNSCSQRSHDTPPPERRGESWKSSGTDSITAAPTLILKRDVGGFSTLLASSGAAVHAQIIPARPPRRIIPHHHLANPLALATLALSTLFCSQAPPTAAECNSMLLIQTAQLTHTLFFPFKLC